MTAPPAPNLLRPRQCPLGTNQLAKKLYVIPINARHQFPSGQPAWGPGQTILFGSQTLWHGGSGYTVIQSGLKNQKCPIVPGRPSMGSQAYSAKQGGLAMSCLLHPPQPHLDLACLAWPQLTSPQHCSPEAGNKRLWQGPGLLGIGGHWPTQIIQTRKILAC